MRIDTVVLGASGYVGSELLRLIGGHPEFRLGAAVSASRCGEAIGSVYPTLATQYPGICFANPDLWLNDFEEGDELALFSAAPHGSSAKLVHAALDAAARRNVNLRIVDSSADFRYPCPKQFEDVYGLSHAAPSLLDDFHCGVPEHVANHATKHVGHPGCFATAILLAAVPLAQSGLVVGDIYVNGITGSTGSGSTPRPGTHHPERHNNLYAYNPLSHRHVPEVERLLTEASGKVIAIRFVPHSGPFARGIHVTLQAKLQSKTDSDDVAEIFRTYYRDAPFVHYVNGTPRLKDVVTSNHCHLSAVANNDNVAVMCVIDNLVKGAAGGALQWMNRMWSLPESLGLQSAAPAWV